MWEEKNNRLVRSFKFKNFVEAMEFMNKAGEVAEKMNHHPDWRNVYNRVEVELCTHDAGNCVTEKDRNLALEMDKIYAHYT
jgi:4a-hydroxytetrahydrobiopterin dehydratase